MGAAPALLMADRLGTHFDDHRVAQLVEADVASWSGVHDTMVALVEELAECGRRIALLSNVPEESALHYEARHAWLGLRGMCLLLPYRPRQARTGRLPVVCEGPARRGGSHPLRRRPGNVQAAEATGMRGHLFTASDRLREHLARWDAAACDGEPGGGRGQFGSGVRRSRS